MFFWFCDFVDIVICWFCGWVVFCGLGVGVGGVGFVGVWCRLWWVDCVDLGGWVVCFVFGFVMFDDVWWVCVWVLYFVLIRFCWVWLLVGGWVGCISFVLI